jgi:hypothetical protein
MRIRTKLLAAGAALFLSSGAALAVPATAQTDLNVRSGPGTQYPVVGSVGGGESVDVGSCTGSWCQVSFSGGSGFANRSYLAMNGAGPAVAATPYVSGDDYAYDDGYYDDGYAYGPSVGFFIGPDGRRHRGHNGWNGHDGRTGWNGAGRPGNNWSGRGPGVTPAPQQGFAGPPAGWQRPGTGIGPGAGFQSRGMRSAPVGMPSGGAGFGGGRSGGAGFGGAHVGGGAPAGGAQGGFAGSITHGR